MILLSLTSIFIIIRKLFIFLVDLHTFDRTMKKKCGIVYYSKLSNKNFCESVSMEIRQIFVSVKLNNQTKDFIKENIEQRCDFICDFSLHEPNILYLFSIT